MSAQTVTILSGILLLVVFALVAWNLRRHRDPSKQDVATGDISDGGALSRNGRREQNR